MTDEHPIEPRPFLTMPMRQGARILYLTIVPSTVGAWQALPALLRRLESRVCTTVIREQSLSSGCCFCTSVHPDYRRQVQAGGTGRPPEVAQVYVTQKQGLSCRGCICACPEVLRRRKIVCARPEVDIGSVLLLHIDRGKHGQMVQVADDPLHQTGGSHHQVMCLGCMGVCLCVCLCYRPAMMAVLCCHLVLPLAGTGRWCRWQTTTPRPFPRVGPAWWRMTRTMVGESREHIRHVSMTSDVTLMVTATVDYVRRAAFKQRSAHV